MSPIHLSLVILTTTLLSGPSLAHATQPPSSTVLVRSARQLYVIVDRDLRASPLYPQLCQTAKRIEHCAEAIHDHFDHRVAVPHVRQQLLELHAALAQLDQFVAQLPSKTGLQAHQIGYHRTASAQVTIGNGYVYQATPAYRPQLSLNAHDLSRLQRALADVETAADDFGCALTAWERATLWDFGGWDRPRHAPPGPLSPLGLSNRPQPHRR